MESPRHILSRHRETTMSLSLKFMPKIANNRQCYGYSRWDGVTWGGGTWAPSKVVLSSDLAYTDGDWTWVLRKYWLQGWVTIHPRLEYDCLVWKLIIVFNFHLSLEHEGLQFPPRAESLRLSSQMFMSMFNMTPLLSTISRAVRGKVETKWTSSAPKLLNTFVERPKSHEGGWGRRRPFSKFGLIQRASGILLRLNPP